MKTSLVLLSLAVVAVSNAAVLSGPERSSWAVGNIGPGDLRLTTYSTIHTPISGQTLRWVESMFSRPNINIVHIQVIDAYNSGATAEIVSGGLGFDQVTIKYTPYENRPFRFETDIHGSYFTKESGSLPETVTFERRVTTPSQ